MDDKSAGQQVAGWEGVYLGNKTNTKNVFQIAT